VRRPFHEAAYLRVKPWRKAYPYDSGRLALISTLEIAV